MAIQPIDLQVLFTQIETVSKTVVSQQQGAQLSNAIQQEEVSKKLAEKNTAVQKTPEDGEEVARLGEQEANNGGAGAAGSDRKRQPAHPEEAAPALDIEYVTDPELGRHIDVTG